MLSPPLPLDADEDVAMAGLWQQGWAGHGLASALSLGMRAREGEGRG